MARISGLILFFCLAPIGVRADILVLKEGGRVHGEVQQVGDKYKVKLSSGEGEVIFAADRVKRLVRESVAEKRYQELLTRMPETALGHWKMAKWCLQNDLGQHRKRHLENVIRIDPNHEEARRALGYQLSNDRWMNRAELMRQRGFVLHNGKYQLKQEVDLDLQNARTKELVQQWRTKLRRWRKQVGKSGEAAALEELRDVRDPLATKGLLEWFERARREHVRAALVRALGRMGTADAVSILVKTAVQDESEELRLLCLDQLEERGRAPAIASFITALKSNDNAIILRGAVGLARLDATEAVPDLIKSLVTIHRIAPEAQSGRVGATFGQPPGGSGNGLSVGGSPKPKRRQVNNQEVLDALLKLTENVNFEYDQLKWRQWHMNSSLPTALDLRRGA